MGIQQRCVDLLVHALHCAPGVVDMPMNDDEVVLTTLRTASEIEAERLANKALKEPNPNIAVADQHNGECP